jgi:primosomal protein N''
LTLGAVLRYTARMPIHFVLPKKFTRAQIEWRVDELALQFQGTKDKKLLAQIAALNRVLARMDVRESNASNPRNRQ